MEWFNKSAFGEKGAFELFDLIEDPGEQNNLAETSPGMVAEMRRKLDDWRKQIDAQMPIPNPDYDPQHEANK